MKKVLSLVLIALMLLSGVTAFADNGEGRDLTEFWGSWVEPLAGRGNLDIENAEGIFSIRGYWSSSASEHREWELTGEYDSEKDAVIYSGYRYDVAYSDNEEVSLTFVLKDGELTWQEGAVDFDGEPVVFEKLTDENAESIDALAGPWYEKVAGRITMEIIPGENNYYVVDMRQGITATEATIWAGVASFDEETATLSVNGTTVKEKITPSETDATGSLKLEDGKLIWKEDDVEEAYTFEKIGDFAELITAEDEDAVPAAPITSAISVKVLGEYVAWNEEGSVPFIDENNRTLVPLRAVAEAMGLDVEWDAAARTARFSKVEANVTKQISFPIGSRTARFELIADGTVTEGGEVLMDTQAVIVNSRTYAPVRYLAENFGYVVDWDASTKTVLINTEAVTDPEKPAEGIEG